MVLDGCKTMEFLCWAVGSDGTEIGESSWSFFMAGYSIFSIKVMQHYTLVVMVAMATNVMTTMKTSYSVKASHHSYLCNMDSW